MVGRGYRYCHLNLINVISFGIFFVKVFYTFFAHCQKLFGLFRSKFIFLYVKLNKYRIPTLIVVNHCDIKKQLVKLIWITHFLRL